MKKITFFIIILVGIFIIPDISLAKINSYEIQKDNWGHINRIILNLNGFLSPGTVCTIQPTQHINPTNSAENYYITQPDGSFNNPADLYNIVINNHHLFGGANISGTIKNHLAYPSVIICSESKVVIDTTYFGNFKVGSAPYVVTVGNSTMSVVDEIMVYFKDIWDCGNWTTCSSAGSQTRICNLVADSPSENIPSPATAQSCAPPCIAESWSCADWNQCSVDGSQTRVCNKINCEGGIASPITMQSCIFIPPTCTSWTYSDWSSCSFDGNQTRSVISSSPDNCIEGNPVLDQSCTYVPPVPSCTITDWSCTDWGTCSQNNNQTRTCAKNSNCQNGVSSPITSQYCTYVAPVPSCISFNYSDWSSCSSNGNQTRSIISKYPSNCNGGELPIITQSCVYTPPCTADKWDCDNWGPCSLSGIQTRSCKKIFDCSSVETAPPTTSQYCEAPNRPAQTIPQNSDEILNQSAIIKATVKLICPFDERRASQGSGTVIDSSGLILTNQHVVSGTLGCLVGFIDNFDDEPYFGNRQIADIQKISSNEDIAILKLRNPQNKKLTYINIKNANIDFKLGSKINLYGYPAEFGTNITYTSGDFSGVSGNYLKTTAIIEYGNSGGGAYFNNGKFIGIPTAVIKGELNALGYILSVNVINSWMGNSSVVYNNNNQNNYSRVSAVLETIDLETLDLLELVIPGIPEEKDIEVVPDSSITPLTSTETTATIPVDKNKKELEIKKQDDVVKNNFTATVLDSLGEESNEDISENIDKKAISNIKEVKQKSLWERIKNWFIFWK